MHTHIFNRKYLNEHLSNFDINSIEGLENKLDILRKWKISLESKSLDKTKEKSVQGTFLIQIFVNILGYSEMIGNSKWNIILEKSTELDATSADASLGFYTSSTDDTKVVIELKDAKTELDSKQNRKNPQTPVEQAFSYQSKHKDCRWIIVSNIREIRVYNAQTMTAYEKFIVEDLVDENEFKRFYFLLNRDNLIAENRLKSPIDILYANNDVEEAQITEEFYKYYKNVRLKLLKHIIEQNSSFDELILLEKTQKILDRLIFIRFCEDSKFIPRNSFQNIIARVNESLSRSDDKVWAELKELFESIDKGNERKNINRFNGGLFKTDPILDNLIIKDFIFDDVEKILNYDFESEVDVNLLGHIFEQSISDLEELRAELRGEDVDKNKSKQKQDGVFYTPPFITNFLVSKIIGDWIFKKRIELGEESLPELNDEDFKEYNSKFSKGKRKGKNKQTNVEKHIVYYEKLQDVIRNIKILDPACGSGAFLNAAYDYLYNVGMSINLKLEHLSGSTSLFDLDSHILRYNLFGVDLNKESVEITKLSLWIKTANATDPLTALDENIRSGNSVVSDLEYHPNPFIWKEEFKEILENGGFDIIIGNPPYVRQERIVDIKEHLKKNFTTYHGRADLYVYFFEKAFEILKKDGIMGYICSSKYTTTTYGQKLREYMVEKCDIKYFIDFDDLDVFKNIIAYPSILIAGLKQENQKLEDTQYCYFEYLDTAIENYFSTNKRLYPQEKISPDVWNFLEDEIGELNEKLLNKYKTLESILGNPNAGVKTGRNGAYILSESQAADLIKADPKSQEIIKSYANGKDIKPYTINPKHYIIFPYLENKDSSQLELVDIELYPAVKDYLETFKISLESRAIIKDGLQNGSKKWYEYQQINKNFSFEKEYIVYPDIANRSSFAITKGNVLDMTLFWIETDKPFRELAILNSTVFNFLFNLISTDARGGYKRFKSVFMKKIPYVNAEGDEELNNLVIQSLNFAKEKEAFHSSIVHFLKNKFNLESDTFETWSETSFNDLINDLMKKKIKLSMNQELELNSFLDIQKNEINILDQKIQVIHQQLNDKVISMYNLTTQEIELIKSKL